MPLLIAIIAVAALMVFSDGAAWAQAPSTRSSPGGALASELGRFPEFWEAHPGGGIRHRKSGLVCAEDAAEFTIAAVATALDGGLCGWTRGPDDSFAVGAKDRSGGSMTEAARTALGIVGGPELPPDTQILPYVFNHCAAVTASMLQAGMKFEVLVVDRGEQFWIAIAAARSSADGSTLAIEGAVRARDSYIGKQVSCEPRV